MKKYLKIITLIFVSNMLISIANAGSDGSLEIQTKSSSGEINDCFEKLIEVFLHSTKDWIK